MAVAEFNGVLRDEDLKNASLVLIAHRPDGTSPLAPAVQSLMLHPGVNICPKIILAIRYFSSLLPPPSGHFGQTLSDKRDPLDLIFLALLLDMLFLGT